LFIVITFLSSYLTSHLTLTDIQKLPSLPPDLTQFLVYPLFGTQMGCDKYEPVDDELPLKEEWSGLLSALWCLCLLLFKNWFGVI